MIKSGSNDINVLYKGGERLYEVRQGEDILSPTSRYFTDFDGVDDFIFLDNPVSIAGDYEAEFLVYYPNGATGTRNIVGGTNSGSFTRFALYQLNGRITVQQPLTGGTLNYSIGVSDASGVSGYNKVVLKRVGNTVTLSLNNVSKSVTRTDYDNFYIQNIGRFGSGNRYDGIISDVRIWSGGDRDSGNLIHWWVIDEGTGTNTITDFIGGNNGTRNNVDVLAIKQFNLNQSTTPHQWERSDGQLNIPINF